MSNSAVEITLLGRTYSIACPKGQEDALRIVAQGVEDCDDGNQVTTDACTNTCTVARCGDGIARTDLSEGDSGYEACDDGNDVDTDACLSNCQAARCDKYFPA